MRDLAASRIAHSILTERSLQIQHLFYDELPSRTHRQKTTGGLMTNRSTGGKCRRSAIFCRPFVACSLVSLSLRLIHGAAVDFGTANAVNACSRFQFRYPLRFARKSNPPVYLIYCNGPNHSMRLRPTPCREHSQANVGGQKKSRKRGFCLSASVPCRIAIFVSGQDRRRPPFGIAQRFDRDRRLQPGEDLRTGQ